jgi:predicted glycogen debranching enzyme
MIEFDERLCRDLATAKSKEWLVTNGIGGYSSSTVAGLNTRRYHGLLVAATKPPVGRFVLLSQIEDVLVVDGKRFDLSTNIYRDSVVHPAGHMNLSGFSLDSFPVYLYSRDDWQITKSVWMVYGENTTVIEYVFTSTQVHANVSLEVRPLVAFRDYHGTTHENDALDRAVVQTPQGVEFHPYPDLPTLYLAHDTAAVQVDGYWYRNFEYVEERARGLDYSEDLFSPLIFKADLTRGRRFCLVASTERHSTSMVAQCKRSEFHRASLAHYKYRAEFGQSDLIPLLYRAAEQFIVSRYPQQTVLAGYHWFADWGRDAMIALPGLLLETDRPDLARGILLQYVAHIDGGMLPNRFPDSGETPEYNTVDATLWFFEAIRQYFHYRKDAGWREAATQFIREHLYAALKGIVSAHLAGTRFGIHVDEEGFLWAGDLSTQLTWMDARVGDVAITPRAGRPVEIQALWYNALRTLEDFARLLGDHIAAASYAELAAKLKTHFEAVFWNGEYLDDVADRFQNDRSIRPNQIFAISLHHSLLAPERARKILDLVERELLTPYGLRTLSARDERYRGRCEGDVWSRDNAYHQGTVWPWLAGPFFSAKLRVSDLPEQTMLEIAGWLDHLTPHLREAGLGQISEIFDGDFPHTPRGCIAQAWSVAEILRLAKLVTRHPTRGFKTRLPVAETV